MARIGELEAAVMQELWRAQDSVTVRQVLEALQAVRGPSHPLAYTTVMTVMERLHRKGLLTRQTTEMAYRYRPSESQADHAARVMSDALGVVEDRGAALIHFADRLNDAERTTLRQALTRARRSPRSPNGS